MNKNSLAKYLEKINNNQLINIPLFLKSAEAFSLTETQLLKIISWRKINSRQYSISILNQTEFDSLVLQFPCKPITNRVEASSSGDSHIQQVSGSILSLLAFQQDFPQLVIISNNGDYQSPGKLHHNLLIIENLENFLALIQHPDKLKLWLDNDWSCDIVYAQGNAISNQLHQKFFSQYAKIRCLLDIDLGGFRIFKNINQLTPSCLCEFVFSHYYSEKYQQYGTPLTHQQRLQFIQEYTQNTYPNALEEIILHVLKYNQFAEQEILLCN